MAIAYVFYDVRIIGIPDKEEITMKIGIDLGGSHMNIGLVDEKNEIIDKMDYLWSAEEKKNLYSTMQNYCLELIFVMVVK